MFHNPTQIPERQLVFGGAGAGKSYNWLRMADFAQATGSTARFVVVDTDNAARRMIATEFPDLSNVDVRDCYEWEHVSDVMKLTVPQLTADDWLIIDLLNPTWDMVQEHFTERVFNTGMDEFFLQARADQQNKRGGSAFDGWKDWTVINKLYRSFTNQILRAPCNVYATAAGDAVNLDTDEKDVRNTFAPLGVKPRGQKHTPHIFHSVLLQTIDRSGVRRLTTGKDRGRTMHQGLEMTDYVTQYMMATAGWRP